jgi:hypothetical protein
MSGEHRPVRVTPTYAGPDSKGIVSVMGWDLEGMVAFYLVGGGVIGLLVVFALAGSSIFVRLSAGLVPVVLACLWVKIFVHGRPPAYQMDVFEGWLRGATFRLDPQKWCRKRHPRAILASIDLDKEASHG